MSVSTYHNGMFLWSQCGRKRREGEAATEAVSVGKGKSVDRHRRQMIPMLIYSCHLWNTKLAISCRAFWY
jgi:hypothetical protein